MAIFGMGRLGNACKELIEAAPEDFELVECFNRANADTLLEYKEWIDVLLVCVGSATDAPKLTHKFAKNFSTVDSFDTHADLGKYMAKIRRTQGEGLVSVIGTGWDPGLMSIMRLYLKPLFSNVESYWGPGVSLGHSNAIRRIEGVKDAIQFTIPDIKNKTHKRLCFVVANPPEHRRIANEITGMPHYFAPYKTKVKFISSQTFYKKFTDRQEHAGQVLAGDDYSTAKFHLRLDSNPRFTAQSMLAYAIAAHNLKKEGQSGVFSVADIAPRYLFRKEVLELV